MHKKKTEALEIEKYEKLLFDHGFVQFKNAKTCFSLVGYDDDILCFCFRLGCLP